MTDQLTDQDHAALAGIAGTTFNPDITVTLPSGTRIDGATAQQHTDRHPPTIHGMHIVGDIIIGADPKE